MTVFGSYCYLVLDPDNTCDLVTFYVFHVVTSNNLRLFSPRAQPISLLRLFSPRAQSISLPEPGAYFTVDYDVVL